MTTLVFITRFSLLMCLVSHFAIAQTTTTSLTPSDRVAVPSIRFDFDLTLTMPETIEQFVGNSCANTILPRRTAFNEPIHPFDSCFAFSGTVKEAITTMTELLDGNGYTQLSQQSSDAFFAQVWIQDATQLKIIFLFSLTTDEYGTRVLSVLYGTNKVKSP